MRSEYESVVLDGDLGHRSSCVASSSVLTLLEARGHTGL
jgi:hypothetical protein